MDQQTTQFLKARLGRKSAWKSGKAKAAQASSVFSPQRGGSEFSAADSAPGSREQSEVGTGSITTFIHKIKAKL